MNLVGLVNLWPPFEEGIVSAVIAGAVYGEVDIRSAIGGVVTVRSRVDGTVMVRSAVQGNLEV